MAFIMNIKMLYSVTKLWPLCISLQMILEAKRKEDEERIRMEMVSITTYSSLFGLPNFILILKRLFHTCRS